MEGCHPYSHFLFIKVATAMFGYMTDLNSVDVVREEEIMAEGTCTQEQFAHQTHFPFSFVLSGFLY